MLREEADVDGFEVMEPGGSPKYLKSVGQAANTFKSLRLPQKC